MDPKAAQRQAIMQEVFRRMNEIDQQYANILLRMGCKRITLHRF